VQYFIWQNDPSGILVIDRLLRAADRGVRIRGLIDDVQLEGLVSRLNSIGKHPNIEIRIFNPFSVRLGFRLGLFRLMEFAIDGNRLNHRMHNKLLVVDNQIAMLGGRNIGDDYFGRSTKRNFVDTDLLISGAAVAQLSEGFDRYWNSGWAVSVEELLNVSLVSDDLASLRERIRIRLRDYPELVAKVDESRIVSLVRSLLSGHVLRDALAVVDDPDVSWGEKPNQVAEQLTEIALSAEREVLIVSPYLVLTPNLLQIGRELGDRGVRISVITNSLASNDVVIAHAAYARYRQTILDTGTALYEYRGDPAMMAGDPAEAFSLHSKYIIFDDDELGVVLQSESLAAELRAYYELLTSPANAWQVVSSSEGLRWESDAGVRTRQPAKSGWQNLRSSLMMLLPVSNQL
jgi:putative cardiolipin synthase